MELEGQRAESEAGTTPLVGREGGRAFRVGLMAGGEVAMAGGRQEGMRVAQRTGS